jgi:hypothetical protein
MKLVVPYIGELQAEDARLMRLATFLGICCDPLPLEDSEVHCPDFWEKVIPDRLSCLLINPSVFKKWLGETDLPESLIAALRSHFAYLIVHAVSTDPFDVKMVSKLSQGQLQAIGQIEGATQSYEIAQHAKDICGAFSGLRFGPANPANDLVFARGSADSSLRPLMSIGQHPFMAASRQERTEILFLGTKEVAELDEQVGDAPLTEYFSRLVPHVMALRHIFGEECWRPNADHAAVIIDDPLLRLNYGFINFDSLVRLARENNFHATVAFIPHNFRRSSARVLKIFDDNPDHLSLCFHGNDHTGAELASSDFIRLNTMLDTAERRMSTFRNRTGLDCRRIMVFPQGKFSVEAMSVLKCRNFEAAVNTVSHPTDEPVRITIGELMQPAVLRYGSFPLFLRRKMDDTQSHDIAFSLLSGRPVLIVTHHGDFQCPQLVVELAARVNGVSPGIKWSNLASALRNSTLIRRTPDGTLQVRAFSCAVQIDNDSDRVKRFSIEWPRSYNEPMAIDAVIVDQKPYRNFHSNEHGITVAADLASGRSQVFSLEYRNPYKSLATLGFGWNVKACLRRRMSEVRDNYLSRNRYLLAVAKKAQRLASTVTDRNVFQETKRPHVAEVPKG